MLALWHVPVILSLLKWLVWYHCSRVDRISGQWPVACVGLFVSDAMWWGVSFCLFFSDCDFILRQKQMTLKKRQWHVAHESQQPDWGKQLWASWEHLIFTAFGLTLAGGQISFWAAGAPLGFCEVGRKTKQMVRASEKPSDSSGSF